MSKFRVTRPGIYVMPEADYFADPCPQPSFTQSIAKIILNRSPRHAWHAHPRLNPQWEPDTSSKFNIGNIAHAELLGKGKTIHVVEANDWRTNAAKDERAKAEMRGQIAVLSKEVDRALAMVTAARKQLADNEIDWATQDPECDQIEACLTWKKDDKWLRAKPDRIQFRTLYDYKTTMESASPEVLATKMVRDGWDVQGAMYEQGRASLGGLPPGWRSVFLVQEAYPPYALSVCEIGEGALTIGRQKLDHAWQTWCTCLEANRWPTYTNRATPLRYPAWATAQWEETVLSEHVADMVADA